MKKALLAVVCCLLAVGNLTAQEHDSIPQGRLGVLAGQLSKNSATSQLFSLADELMLMDSFDEVASLLIRSRFPKVEMDEGVLTASSPMCDLRAVNRMNTPEQIDTLTLFVKRSLNRRILEDSLRQASYTHMKTSDDGRYEWYKRADNVNLAVYYIYTDEYPSAMLYARPQRTIHIGRE